MAQAKVTLTDDEGQIIATHAYAVGQELTTLGQMEASLEALRPPLLSDLTHDLLAEEQRRFQKKRRSSGAAAIRCKSKR